MNLTTTQAAEKLGTRRQRIVALIKQGVLHDVSESTDPRHEYKIDSREVSELAKTYRARRNGHVLAPAPEPEPERVEIKPMTSSSPLGILSRVEDRLARVEERLGTMGAIGMDVDAVARLARIEARLAQVDVRQEQMDVLLVKIAENIELLIACK